MKKTSKRPVKTIGIFDTTRPDVASADGKGYELFRSAGPKGICNLVPPGKLLTSHVLIVHSIRFERMALEDWWEKSPNSSWALMVGSDVAALGPLMGMPIMSHPRGRPARISARQAFHLAIRGASNLSTLRPLKVTLHCSFEKEEDAK